MRTACLESCQAKIANDHRKRRNDYTSAPADERIREPYSAYAPVVCAAKIER